jgi:hypothetical protein
MMLLLSSRWVYKGFPINKKSLHVTGESILVDCGPHALPSEAAVEDNVGASEI